MLPGEEKGWRNKPVIEIGFQTFRVQAYHRIFIVVSKKTIAFPAGIRIIKCLISKGYLRRLHLGIIINKRKCRYRFHRTERPYLITSISRPLFISWNYLQIIGCIRIKYIIEAIVFKIFSIITLAGVSVPPPSVPKYTS